MLVTWTKDPEPVVARPPEGMKITGFRDPSAWRSGDGYYMTVGSGVKGEGGCVLLYRSRDLKSWEYLHKLTGGQCNATKTANPCEDGTMWECPEFFPLGSGHVLIYSTLGKSFWESGVLDEATMTFAAKKRGLLIGERFMRQRRRWMPKGGGILWGWIQERRDDAAMKAAGWSGMMSLPRVLSLDADGSLTMETLPALKALRAGKIKAEGMQVALPQATGEVLCTGEVGKDFTVTISDGAVELVRIAYEAAAHSFRVDERVIALGAGDAPVVHGFVDGSVIEVMLDGRVGVTKRFYYTGLVAPILWLSLREGRGWRLGR